MQYNKEVESALNGDQQEESYVNQRGMAISISFVCLIALLNLYLIFLYLIFNQ